MSNYIYCAVNKNNKIVEVRGSSRKTTYFKTDKYLKDAVEKHNEIYPKDKWRTVRFKLVEDPENVRCDCYEVYKTCEPRYNTITGQIDHYVDVEYGRCRGTRERDICTCGGNEKKCDFYEHKRK